MSISKKCGIIDGMKIDYEDYLFIFDIGPISFFIGNALLRHQPEGIPAIGVSFYGRQRVRTFGLSLKGVFTETDRL